MKRLTGWDAFLLYSEAPNVHMHTLKIAIIELVDMGGRTFGIDDFRHVINARLHKLYPLRYELVDIPFKFHHPMWRENVYVDLDYHVRPLTLPAPGGRRELDDAIGEIASTPLDRSRPLWKMYFVDGLADGRIAVVNKVHHALADGVAAANLLALGMDLQPGFEDKDCRVRGGVILYGLTDFTGIFEHHPHPIAHYLLEELVFRRRYREDADVFRRAQPVSYLSADIPPLLLIHGEHDVMIPIVEAHNFYQRLKEAGARRVHLCEVPMAPHAFEIAPTPLQQRTQRIIERFLATL